MEQTLKINVDLEPILERLDRLESRLLNSNNEQYKPIYTTKETAELLGFGKQIERVNQLRRIGLLRGTKKGITYVYTRKAIDDCLEMIDGKSICNISELKFIADERKRNRRSTTTGI